MSVLELAKRYYPRLWDDRRLEALVEAGRLTRKEADLLRKESGDGKESGVKA